MWRAGRAFRQVTQVTLVPMLVVLVVHSLYKQCMLEDSLVIVDEEGQKKDKMTAYKIGGCPLNNAGCRVHWNIGSATGSHTVINRCMEEGEC
jgi:hypothetical protein